MAKGLERKWFLAKRLGLGRLGGETTMHENQWFGA